MKRRHNPKELSEVQTLRKEIEKLKKENKALRKKYNSHKHVYENDKLENELDLELAKEALTQEAQLGQCSECMRHGIEIIPLLGRLLKRCQICGHNFGAINK